MFWKQEIARYFGEKTARFGRSLRIVARVTHDSARRSKTVRGIGRGERICKNSVV